MKTKQLFLACLLAVAGSGTADAYDIDLNGLYYNVTGENTVEVTYVEQGFGNGDFFSGDINIPRRISSGGKTYTVTAIGDGAFAYCYHLTSITIPNSVTSIGERAFYFCSNPNLASITIPSSVTSIGEEAFYFCSNLASITIPSSVTSIGDRAFFACQKLASITIPSSVTSIGEGAFSCGGGYLSSIISIIVEEGNTVYDSRNGCNAIIEKKSNTLIAGCKNTVIPNSVTSIGNNAFSGCSLTSITIPSSVTSIGELAFYYCSNLASITIPSSVTSIGEEAFSRCLILASITIPSSVNSIGEGAFDYCSGIEAITVEKDNKVYDSRNGCNAIIEKKSNTLIAGCKNTVIPNSVTSIGHDTFSGCTGLTSITIPESVTSIGNYAFIGCSGLTSITIPESVTSIGHDAFSGCTGLTSITFPESVTIIGDMAFDQCPALTSVTSYMRNPAMLPYSCFGYISSNCVLTIPYGTASKYESAGWTRNVFQGGIVEDKSGLVKNLAELSNTKQYLIHTQNGNRGSLVVYEGHLATTNPMAVGRPYYCSAVSIQEDSPLISSVNQLSSPYTEPSEGSLAALLDGDGNTFWHSNWRDGSVANGTHYFQVEMVDAEALDVAFRFTRRITTSDHITVWGVYGTNVADAVKGGCELLANISTPYRTNSETLQSTVFSTGGYKYLRFYINGTTGGRGYGHLSEFQIYPATYCEECGEASPFALLKKDGGYYLYSVRDKAFIGYQNDGDETAFPWQQGDNQMSITKEGDCFVFDFTEPNSRLNVNNNPGIQINNWKTLDAGNQFAIEEVGDFDPTEALAAFDSYELEVPATGLTTLYALRALETPEDDGYLGTFYGKSVEDEQLHLGRVGNVIPAETPVLVMANPGTYSLQRASTAGKRPANNLLQGTKVDLPVADISGSVFTLGSDPAAPGFYLYDDTTLPAFSVFLALDDVQGVKALRLPLGGVVTGVEDVPTATTNGTVYDLSGRTMPKAAGASLPKGLYIVNGKKVVVK